MTDEQTTHIEITVTLDDDDTPSVADTFIYHFINTLHMCVVAGLILTFFGVILSL